MRAASLKSASSPPPQLLLSYPQTLLEPAWTSMFSSSANGLFDRVRVVYVPQARTAVHAALRPGVTAASVAAQGASVPQHTFDFSFTNKQSMYVRDLMLATQERLLSGPSFERWGALFAPPASSGSAAPPLYALAASASFARSGQCAGVEPATMGPCPLQQHATAPCGFGYVIASGECLGLFGSAIGSRPAGFVASSPASPVNGSIFVWAGFAPNDFAQSGLSLVSQLPPPAPVAPPAPTAPASIASSPRPGGSPSGHRASTP